MNINRNNYEEYFLLYIDNELSVAEKNMVEAFVANNPDLGEELVMLQQSIVKPDPIAFPGKEQLVKAGGIDAGIQEKLLLLLDNELPAADKQQLLELTIKDASVKEEWEVLQQTKLSAAEAIVFEDKPSLYKKETRVVPVAWWRMAAAAMLIGFGLWGTVSYINRNEGKKPEIITAGKEAVQPNRLNKGMDTTVTGLQNNTVEESAVAAKQNNTDNIGGENTTARPVAPHDAVTKENTSSNIAAADNEDNKKITDDSENINNNGSNQKIFANVSPETKMEKPENTVEIEAIPAKENVVPASFSNTAQPQYASFEPDEEDKPKRTKLGGFFKKVKRQLERKTNIKTGNDDEVRIANISFAMH